MPDDPNICGGADPLSREELEDAVHRAGTQAENVKQVSAHRAPGPPSSRDALRLALAIRVAQALKRLQLGR